MHLLLPILLLAWTARGSAGEPWPAPKVRVERGLAHLAGESGVARLEPWSGPARAGATGHIEIDGAAVIELAWSDRASLVLTGPAAFEWSQASGGSEQWRILRAAHAEFELRCGEVALELAGGWRGALHPGAYGLDSRPPSGVEMRHRAGELLVLERVGDDPALSARCVLAPGDAVLLAHAAESRAESALIGRELPRRAWRGFAWPWGASAAPPEAAAQITAAPLAAEPEPVPPAPEPREAAPPAEDHGAPLPANAPLAVRPADAAQAAAELALARTACATADRALLTALALATARAHGAPARIRREGTLEQTRWGARWSD